MKFKTIAAAALLATASFAASAATTLNLDSSNSAYFGNTSLTGNFADEYLFSVAALTIGDPSVTQKSGTIKISKNSYTDSVAFDSISFFQVVNGAHVALPTTSSGGTSFLVDSLSAGEYGFTVTGHLLPKITVGSYSGTFNMEVTAVPEPTTYGMLLGGLALVGAVARRKAKKAA